MKMGNFHEHIKSGGSEKSLDRCVSLFACLQNLCVHLVPYPNAHGRAQVGTLSQHNAQLLKVLHRFAFSLETQVPFHNLFSHRGNYFFFFNQSTWERGTFLIICIGPLKCEQKLDWCLL